MMLQLQSSHDNVTALRQVFEDSERRITKLKESILMRCKIKEKPDSAHTVVLVNDYLTKRACCRFLRLDMQVCTMLLYGKLQIYFLMFLKDILFVISVVGYSPFG